MTNKNGAFALTGLAYLKKADLAAWATTSTEQAGVSNEHP